MHNLILGAEAERKFLVCDGWPRDAPGHYIRQGYLPAAPGLTLRVRRTQGLGTITVKTPVVAGARWEAEYPIPREAADLLLATCPYRPVEKVRHVWIDGDLRWEIDEFKGRHAGLLVAEVELLHPWQDISLPTWAGEEVTHVRAFHNSVITRTESLSDVLALWRQALIKGEKRKDVRRAADVLSGAELSQMMLGKPRTHGASHRPL